MAESSLAGRLFQPRRLIPRTEGQARLSDAIDASTIVFVHGPAGSGKTRAVVAKAIEALDSGDAKSIILMRPCVGVGMTSGFLPGTLMDKVSPFLRPLLDELRDFYSDKDLSRMIEDGIIELTSLEYARGRNFRRAVVILDEAQNATHADFKVFLTRLADRSKIFVTGDLSRDAKGRLKQCDLPAKSQGAFEEYSAMFLQIEGISRVVLDDRDIVRHPLVKAMVEAGL